MGRWSGILLVASLALNLFLVGSAVGVIVIGARIAHERPAVRPAMAIRRAARVLPPPERRAFIATLRQSAVIVRPTTQQARALRRQAWTSMASPAFDPAAAKATFRQARGLDQTARESVEDAVVDFAARLPAQDRARLGAAVASAFPDPGR